EPGRTGYSSFRLHRALAAVTSGVVIIGAGPAGLTAALELLRRSEACRPIVIEALDQVGGLARTVRHHGNRIDIGGHRFFSKVDWVMDWWQEILPLAEGMGPFIPGADA